jgi:sugar phosphate isomerase/epimerase
MKIAYSSNAYTKNSLSQAIDDIARIGFDGLEILCDRPHWFCPEVADQEAERIAEQLIERGLKVSNLNANTADGYFIGRKAENAFEPALSSLDKEARKWRIDYSCRAIELGALVNANAVCVTSGLPKGDHNRQAQLKHFVDSMKAICDFAERFQMPVGIEYEPELLVEFGEQVLEVIEQVGSPLLGTNLDVGHSFLNGEDPSKIIPQFKGRIWNMHFEDIKDNTHFHLPLGQGELPFASYIEALKAIEYDRFLTVELYTYPDSPDTVGQISHDYLRALIGD